VYLACNLAVFAQNAPEAEIFAGFSYANYELIPGTSGFSTADETISGSPSARLGLIGWNGSLAVNLNRWFSFTTDVSGHYSGSSTSATTTETISGIAGGTETVTIVNTAARPRIYNFFFGPQFSYPSGKLRPFAHFLLGGDHMDIARSESITGSSGLLLIPPVLVSVASGIGFAVAFGGGADYSIKRNLAWRLQADYLTGQGTGQNHVRVSTGLVWRLGN